uniref:Uncharacterized protein n=1 Tax=Corethron hystrix TaxID=216773 RepID=A0A7S1BCU3_9STRA|mmetsp:Transcript_21902/g.49836  ORF Transcript_21902/g.49836 Transcript_21902/m.49836 type:complete len:149 (+) Transcript_21902:219-665(+)
MSSFQQNVNVLLESTRLQFTAEIWTDQKYLRIPKNSQVQATTSPVSPYLDAELFWLPDGKLGFQVHVKENQELKYLNFGSMHTHMFRSDPHQSPPPPRQIDDPHPRERINSNQQTLPLLGHSTPQSKTHFQLPHSQSTELRRQRKKPR